MTDMTSKNETVEMLVGALRQQCLLRGHNGIRGLGIVFRKMDIDFSKGIVFTELRIALERYGLKMSEGYLRTLFHALDKDNNGWIDFAELMAALRAPLNSRRRQVVMEAFDHVDVNCDGVLNIHDLKETAKGLIQILKEQCLRRGLGGIRGLGVVFRTMDIDCSRSIVLDELKIGLEKFGLRMGDNYLKVLFDCMDTDKNGKIDFLEFMKALRKPLNTVRIAVVNEAFDKLDTNKDNVLDVEDLKGL